MIALFNYLLIFNVFAGGFVLFSSPFEFYVGYIFMILFLFVYILRYRDTSINPAFLIVLTVLTISSLVSALLGENTILLIMKQVLGILITGVTYYFLIKVNGCKIEKLFKIYLHIAFWVAVIGIFQEFSFLAKFNSHCYDYSYFISKWGIVPGEKGLLRVNSIFMEPSHFAITMAPAFFISLVTILKNNTFYLSKRKAIVLIVSYVFTFSAIAYIAIITSLILFFSGIKKSKYSLFTLIILPIFSYTAYLCVPDIRMRTDDALKVATCSIKATDSHLSVYVLVSNAFVAYKSFIDNPLFGHGLGSHPVSYDKFIRLGAASGLWREGYPPANRNDAGSLFLRLISETGLCGIVLALYFLFKFRVKLNDNKNLYLISNAIFVLFIVQLLKQGHYFYNGLFFFIWMYYFTYRIYTKPGLKAYE